MSEIIEAGKLVGVLLLAFQFFGSVGVLALGDWWAFLWFGGLCVGIAVVGALLVVAGAFMADWRAS